MWAKQLGEFRDAGPSNEQAELLARRAVAIVRREATRRNARTFAPGDEIPYDVTRVFDLDGDVWERQGQPPGTLKRHLEHGRFQPRRARARRRRRLDHALAARQVRAATELPPKKPTSRRRTAESPGHR